MEGLRTQPLGEQHQRFILDGKPSQCQREFKAVLRHGQLVGVRQSYIPFLAAEG